jgi:hypothetical protein
MAAPVGIAFDKLDQIPYRYHHLLKMRTTDDAICSFSFTCPFQDPRQGLMFATALAGAQAAATKDNPEAKLVLDAISVAIAREMLSVQVHMVYDLHATVVCSYSYQGKQADRHEFFTLGKIGAADASLK